MSCDIDRKLIYCAMCVCACVHCVCVCVCVRVCVCARVRARAGFMCVRALRLSAELVGPDTSQHPVNRSPSTASPGPACHHARVLACPFARLPSFIPALLPSCRSLHPSAHSRPHTLPRFSILCCAIFFC
jgi:hypothetical protein